MPPRNYRKSARRSRTPMLILGGLGLFALMFVGIVGTLWLAGVTLNPFAASKPVEDPFVVRIPINSQPIPAYSRVDRQQLMNPTDGGLMFQKLPPQAAVGMSVVGVDQNGSHVESRVESIKNVDDEVVFVVAGGAEVRQGQTLSLGGAIMNVNAIIGRVVRADKRVGMGFQESTFFPKGTPAGLAGATPQGMRAITLDATRLTGVHSLGAGDQIDLLASVPIASDSGETPATKTEVELLAQNAKVLRPVYVRNEVTQSASLMNGPAVSNVPKYEVAIAVAADDVIPLQSALNQKLPITCIAHSMKPQTEDDTNLVTSSSEEVRVPVTVRPILAYAVVSRDAFVSPATRSIKTVTISKREADRMNVITSVGDALGARTRQDIPAGRYLRHANLIKGPPSDGDGHDVSLEVLNERSSLSSDGKRFVSMLQESEAIQAAPSAYAVADLRAISSLVPLGKRAIAIPWNDLYGAEHLQYGDTIDLMVSYDLERPEKRKETSEVAGTVTAVEREIIRSRDTTRSYEESYAFRSEPWFVATKAEVIGPLGFPEPAPADRAINDEDATQDANERERVALTGPPMLIAVSVLDAENVAAAMVTKEAMFSYSLHSGEGDRSSLKRIAIAPGKISRLERFDEDVFENNRRGPMHRYVSVRDPRFVDAIEFEDIVNYYGRVLSETKSRWEPLRASDFLPPGTSPGLAATLQPSRTIVVAETQYVEAIAAFEEGDHVSIVLRSMYRINDEVQYFGPHRNRRSAEVIVDDAMIVRRELDAVVLELSDSDTAAFQAALAYVKGLNPANGGNDVGQSIPSLVAIARTRHVSPETISTNPSHLPRASLTQIPPVDPAGNLQFMRVIIAGDRDTYAFDRE